MSGRGKGKVLTAEFTKFALQRVRVPKQTWELWVRSSILWLWVGWEKGNCEKSCCCSVAQSCPTLCNPMGCCTPGFLVLHHLPELVQTHVQWVSDAILSCVIPFSSCLLFFPASGFFPISQLFTLGGQSIGASASASVFPITIQGWFLLGLTGLISLQSNELSRVFCRTTIQKHQFFGTQPSLWPNSHICTWLLKKP